MFNLKTTIFNKKYAKIFAVLLVCFVFAISATNVFAGVLSPTMTYYKDNSNNSVYASVGGNIYAVDSSGNRTLSSLPNNITKLPVDPVTLNKDNSSGLSYDFSTGRYVYGSGTNAEYLDPKTDEARITSLSNSVPDITTNSQAAASAAASNPNNGAPKNNSCPSFWTEEGVFCILTHFMGKVVYIILQVLSVLVYIAGMLLDTVFSLTITGLASTFAKIKVPVEEVWKIIRDIINITFIFGLLYVAIGTILRISSNGFNTKKLLTTIITGAILVNFSLFFTQIIIDFSNNFAVVIFNNITQSGDGGLAGSFMNSLNLQSLWNGDLSAIGIIVNGVMGGALIIIVAFVFFVIALLLIVRFLTFIKLMILSPVAIGGGALPKVKEIAGDWWGELTSQCIFAPIFFLMLWIVFKLMDGINLIAPAGTASVMTASGQPDKAGILAMVLRFAIIIGLLIQALITAKKYSAAGAEKLQAGVLKWGGTAALGGAGWIGRNTVGRAANRYADHLKESGKLEKSGFWAGVSRLSYKTSKKTAESTFDARNTKVGGLGDMKLGDANKGGYKAQVDAYRKRAEEEHKDLVSQSARDKEKMQNLDSTQTNAALLAAEREIRDHEADAARVGAKARADADARAVEAAQAAHESAVASGAPEAAVKNAKTAVDKAQAISNQSKKALETIDKGLISKLEGLDFKVDASGLENFMKNTKKELAEKRTAGGTKEDKEFIKMTRDTALKTTAELHTLHKDNKAELELLKKSGERRGMAYEKTYESRVLTNPFMSTATKTEARQNMRKSRKEKSPRELLEEALKANNLPTGGPTPPTTPPTTP